MRLDRSTVRALITSRLFQFLAVGALLLFAAPRERGDRDVVVDARRVDEALRAEQARRGRALTTDEKSEAVRDLVDEEVLAREAVRLGLGTGDAIVRARLAQRMSASLAASLPAPPVAPDELERACATEAARAPERARVAFWFVPKDLPGAADEADAIVRLLRAGGPRSAHGRGQRPPIPDGAVWSEEALAAVTGAAVAHAALHAPVGEAAGPFAAAWGFYVLVPLERRRAEPAEVRADVQAALLRDKQAAAIEAWIGRARRDYVIDVRAPEGQQSFDLAARTGRTAK